MRIIYFGTTGCADSDFPLIRAFHKQGIEVYSYFYVEKSNCKSGLFNVGLKHKNGIISATEYEGLSIYKNYLDLTKVFVVNRYFDSRGQWQFWFYGNLWKKVFRHMKKRKAQLFHATWPLYGEQKILYNLNLKIIQTVHDPFPHSGQYSQQGEIDRVEAFSHAASMVLLSTPQLESFCKNYHVDKSQILLNKMGEFDHLKLLVPYINKDSQTPYVLYVGQIQEHKGIDVLMEAMVRTHQKHPNVKLIVAGKGKFSFDVSKYSSMDYIEIRNYYVEVKEMVELLVNSMFTVCPYKDATQSGVVQTAFSLDIPLVVTNVGDLPLSVQDGVTGKVVPPCDANALSEAMNTLLEHPELLNMYKKNINDVWRKGQSWEPIAQKYIEEYKRIIFYN